MFFPSAWPAWMIFLDSGWQLDPIHYPAKTLFSIVYTYVWGLIITDLVFYTFIYLTNRDGAGSVQ